ncbi:uncharacterized protein LOC106170595 isoform X1 [Lingula anatina]|uniref:Uncharacterized protein LOC106170595 isoform X1 n=1 Tax=Lingula anatina TaxID=7574 RepID=A0A1S3J6E6_LINAN|nr:uncharacterized protein LOC106170595 isoform X1 [Lingula anatina]|eukprot:XP_013405987.1 uncharacterized protein LOC106170595 isoform X1 [Lingula anatina]
MMKGNGVIDKSQGDNQLLLLDSSSDSDVHEHFNLQPLKGKKQRKKTSSPTVPFRRKAGCSIGACVITVVLIIIIVFLSAMAVLYYHLFVDFQKIKMRFNHALESGSQGPEEFQSLHTQVKGLTDSIKTMKTGQNGLEGLSKSVATISQRLDALQKKTDELQKSVAQAPQLQSLPAQIVDTSKEVANLGSQVEAFKTSMKQQNDDLHALQQRVSSLQEKVGGGRENNSPVMSGPTIGGASANILSAAISSLNTTCTRDVGTLQRGLEATGQRVLLLENRTTELGLHVQLLSNKPVSQTNSTQPDWQQLINSAVNSAMEHLRNSSAESESEEEDKSSSNSNKFDEILQQVQNVSELVTSFKQQIDELKQERNSSATSDMKVKPINVSQAMSDVLTSALGAFKEQYNIDILHVNVSLDKLNNTVTDLQQGMMDLTNATNYLKTKLNSLLKVSSTPAMPLGLGTDSVTPPSAVTSTLIASVLETTSPDMTSQVPHTEGEEHEEGDHVDTVNFFVESLQKRVIIPGYETKEKLRKGFSSWDQNGDNRVSYEDLQDHVGPTLPSAEQFVPYDVNHDGLYSLEELEQAQGISGTQDSSQRKPANTKKRAPLSKEDIKELAKALEKH